MPNWKEVLHEIQEEEQKNLENNQDLQDAVLTCHHTFMHTFVNTSCVKIIENHDGVAYIEQAARPSS